MLTIQKLLLTLFFTLAASFAFAQGVAINNDNSTADGSAILDVKATDKGMLVPRVALTSTATAAPVAAPAASLLVYNTATAGDVTPGFYFWNGTAWVRLQSGASAASGWGLTGNASTATDFIGSISNEPFVIRTNNTEKARLTPKGILELGQGTDGSILIGKDAGLNADLQIDIFGDGSLIVDANNMFVGYQAGYSNMSGQNNHFSGYQAGYSNTTGSQNYFSGYQAGYSNTTSGSNYFSGNYAGYSNTMGALNYFSGNSAGYDNTTGNANTFVGNNTGRNNTTGYSNSFFGRQAGNGISTGIENTVIGHNTLTATANHIQVTALGANTNLTTARTNVTLLGFGIANAQCTASNQVLLGNTAVSQIRAQVTAITAYSDARYKTNVSSNVKGLDFITRLNPVTYNVRPTELHKIWGTPDSLVSKIDHSEIEKTRQMGFLAQEVEKAAKEAGFDFTGIDVPTNDKEVYSLRYTDFIMPLVQSVKELNEKNKTLETQNAALQSELSSMKAEIEQIKALLKKD